MAIPLKLKPAAVKTGRVSTPTVPKKGDGQPLHLRYRPRVLEDVIGQDHIIKSLSSQKAAHAFLFTGPSGCGKTTLARILATRFDIDAACIVEIDAATNSGVDNMREILNVMRYRALAGNGRKLLIVDECHALSKQTWQSLLKSIEEPPEHVYWAFCTTEPDKVPATIANRCVPYHLRAVEDELLWEYLLFINKDAGIALTGEIVAAIAAAASGSVRRGLVSLEALRGVTDEKEARRLLDNGIGDELEAVELARLICNGQADWPKAMKILEKLQTESPEGIRLVVINYAASCVRSAKDPRNLLAVLEAFKGPYNASEKFGPLYLSLGTLLLGE